MKKEQTNCHYPERVSGPFSSFELERELGEMVDFPTDEIFKDYGTAQNYCLERLALGRPAIAVRCSDDSHLSLELSKDLGRLKPQWHWLIVNIRPVNSAGGK